MNYSNFTSYLFALLLIFSTAFMVQCDRDSRTDRDQYQAQEDIRIDPEDRRYDGTDDEDITAYRDDRLPGEQQDYHTLEFENRDELVQDMEELRNDLDEELEIATDDAGDDMDMQMHEQIQYDRSELDRAINEVQNATEENWDNVRTEAVQIYERVSSQYDDPSTTDDMDETDDW